MVFIYINACRSHSLPKERNKRLFALYKVVPRHRGTAHCRTKNGMPHGRIADYFASCPDLCKFFSTALRICVSAPAARAAISILRTALTVCSRSASENS